MAKELKNWFDSDYAERVPKVRKERKIIRADIADAIAFLNKMGVQWRGESDAGIIALAVMTRLRLKAERGQSQ